MFELHQTIEVSQRNINPVIFQCEFLQVVIRVFRTQTTINNNIVRSFDNRKSKIRWKQGEIVGRWLEIGQGDTEFIFDVANPSLAYEIEFLPDISLWDYSISLLIPKITPLMVEYSELTGISLEDAQKIPSSLMAQIIMSSNNLSADTRNLASKLSSLETDISTQGTQLIQTRQEMVFTEDYLVDATNFVPEDGYMRATVIHTISASSPQMSLMDATGDEQGLSQLIVTSPTSVKIELTQSQFDNGSFPLTLTIQGKRSAV